MGKVWAVIAREYTERVHNKWFVIATVFAPIMLAAIMILPAWLSVRDRGAVDLTTTVILDATGAGLGERVAARLASGSRRSRRAPEVRVLAPLEISPAESLLTRRIIAGSETGYLVLDSQTLAGERAYYAGRHATALPAMTSMERAVRSALLSSRLEQAGLDSVAAEEITALRLSLTTERITDRGRGGSGEISMMFGFGLAFLLYMSIILYGQAIMRGVIEEKQTRVAETVLSSIKPDALLTGKVLGVSAVWITQLVIWIATGVGLAYAREPILRALGAPAMPFQFPTISAEAGALLVLFFLLGFILYAALFAAAGAMVNTDQEAQQAAQPVMLLLVATIVLIQPVLFNPTGALARRLSLVPFSSPIIMPLRLGTSSVPWQELALALVLLLIGGAVIVWLAARIYRVGMLMYGKKPTVRELVRWVRYA